MGFGGGTVTYHDQRKKKKERKNERKKKKQKKIGQLPRRREQLTEASVMRSDSSANGIFFMAP